MSNYFFNINEELKINNSGLLPHWEQNGKIQFVTFRLIDSLPQSKITELSELKQRVVETHPKPWNKDTETDYYKLISPFESKLLDNGYGSCILKDPSVRQIVSDSMKYFDGSKYKLLAYVIMPNHVHALFQLAEGIEIKSVMHSIKSYTSNKINKIIHKTGSIWMKEYFDRIVRNEQHLISCINYIKANPRFLHEGDFEVHINPIINAGRHLAALI